MCVFPSCVGGHVETVPERRALLSHGRHVPRELRESSGRATQQARGGGQVSLFFVAPYATQKESVTRSSIWNVFCVTILGCVLCDGVDVVARM